MADETPPRVRRTLGQLALALLNATLLLILAILVVALLLVAKVRHFTVDVANTVGTEIRDKVAVRLDALQSATERLADIDAQLAAKSKAADTATAAEIAGLRQDIAALTAQIAAARADLALLRDTGEGGLRAVVGQLMTEAATALTSDTAGNQSSP